MKYSDRGPALAGWVAAALLALIYQRAHHPVPGAGRHQEKTKREGKAKEDGVLPNNAWKK